MTEPTPLVRSKAILSESNLYVILSKVNAGPVEELVRPLCSSEMSMQRPRWSRRRFQHRDLPLTKSVAASSPGRSGLPGHWHPGEPGRQEIGRASCRERVRPYV